MNGTVLWIDDDLSILPVLKRSCRRLQASLVTAQCITEARRLLKRAGETPKVIIVDMIVPVGSDALSGPAGVPFDFEEHPHERYTGLTVIREFGTLVGAFLVVTMVARGELAKHGLDSSIPHFAKSQLHKELDKLHQEIRLRLERSA